MCLQNTGTNKQQDYHSNSMVNIRLTLYAKVSKSFLPVVLVYYFLVVNTAMYVRKHFAIFAFNHILNNEDYQSEVKIIWLE